MSYKVTVFYDLTSGEDQEIIDNQSEEYYFDTLPEAESEAKNHPVGSCEGTYRDGVRCMVSDVIVEEA